MTDNTFTPAQAVGMPDAWIVDGPMPLDSSEVFLTHEKALEAFNDWGKRITPLYKVANALAAQPPAAPVETAPTIENLGAALDLIMAASCEDQHTAAASIAGNIGMVLVNEPPHPDCPHERSSAGTESASDTEMYRLRDLIASHIACQEDCQKMPTGCGCALTAARAIMNGGPQATPLADVLASCKIEHTEFEKWAAAEKYDMHEHPLHYLFMDPKTNAARQGWKAALRYVASALSRPKLLRDGDQK